MKTLAERFWPKVARGDGCWLWQANTNGRYGTIAVRKGERWSMGYAHRIAWELTEGPIPSGLKVLHRCDTTLCVRPSHLFVGTQKENLLDMISKGREACGKKNGAHTRPDRLPRGEHNGSAKLNARAVADIRRRRARGERIALIAAIHGVHAVTVDRIAKRTSWSHVA